MTPSEYTFEIVFPTVRASLLDRQDRRLACLACMATFNLVDRIARADALEPWRVGDAMRLVCADEFEVVQGIAQGTRQSEATPDGTQELCGTVGRIPAGAFGMGRFAVDARTETPDTRRFVIQSCVVKVLEHFARLYPHHFQASASPSGAA